MKYKALLAAAALGCRRGLRGGRRGGAARQPAADERADGEHEGDRLRAGLAAVRASCRRSPSRRARLKLENPSGHRHELRLRERHAEPDDPTRAADGPASAPAQRRRRPSRTRTPTSSSRRASRARTPRYDYGTHFLYQGHEGARHREREEAGLHHADQPRRRRGAPRDAARVAGLDGQPDPDDRRLDVGSVGPAAALHDRERERTDLRGDARYPSTVDDVSGALGRGGYEGIQNDSDGNIWIVEDIGGSIKPARRPRRSRTASSTATSRRTRATWSTASCRRCRC